MGLFVACYSVAVSACVHVTTPALQSWLANKTQVETAGHGAAGFSATADISASVLQ